jgi:putative flippase GtrA
VPEAARDGIAAQALRYGLVGLVNTGVGLGVIAFLEFGLHLSPYLANAGGYGAGFVIGFVLSKLFVFRARGGTAASGLRYGVAVALAYGLNLVVLTLARRLLPDGGLFHLAAQLSAMGAYTVSLFLASRYFVFAGATR